MSRAKALSKYLRISPRKARLAAGLIRNLPVEDAKTQLTFGGTKACRMLAKTLGSAVANAELEHGVSPEELIVDEVRIDPGPTLKRSKSKCRGGRSPILKRTSHMTVVVSS